MNISLERFTDFLPVVSKLSFQLSKSIMNAKNLLLLSWKVTTYIRVYAKNLFRLSW